MGSVQQVTHRPPPMSSQMVVTAAPHVGRRPAQAVYAHGPGPQGPHGPYGPHGPHGPFVMQGISPLTATVASLPVPKAEVREVRPLDRRPAAPPATAPGPRAPAAVSAPAQKAPRKKAPVEVPVEVVPSTARPTFVPPYMPKRVLTTPSVELMDPPTAKQYMDKDPDGTIVIDLRENDDDVIHGACSVSVKEVMGRLHYFLRAFANKRLVVFMCEFGAQMSPNCANFWKSVAGQQRVGVVVDGFRGWEAFQLPVRRKVAPGTQKTPVKAAPKAQPQPVPAGPGAQPVPQVVAKAAPALQAPKAAEVPASAAPAAAVPVPATRAPMPEKAESSPSRPQIPSRPWVRPDDVDMVVQPENGVECFDPLVIKTMLSTNQGLLVDMRDPLKDRRIGFIDGSLNIPAVTTDENGQIVMPFYHQIEHLAKEWSQLPLVVLYCQHSLHRAPQTLGVRPGNGWEG
ncbi:unnamed protein product [Effrenium voratum]|uniref:Rhodanese domain-containing protein n=1 Tax=Effrenium voratum TaxID=2562239 RepID=A0AA36NBM0_9DINO|nr:unnamed protein product [Effrenium voratum]